MLTPQEVQDKKFAKAVFGGYDMAEVDDFLDALHADYASLYKENAILKNKLKVLVETVEEYRSVDEAMRKALLTAQKMAAEMTDEAKQKATTIVQGAETEAEKALGEIKQRIALEEARFNDVQAEARRYADMIIATMRQQIELVEGLKAPLPQTAAHVPPRTPDIAADIAEAIQKPYTEEARAEAPAEPVPVSPAPLQTAPRETLENDANYQARAAILSTFPSENPVGPADLPEAAPEMPRPPESAMAPDFPRTDEAEQSVNIGGVEIKVYEAQLSGEARGDVFDDEQETLDV
ncbi:DivIVA domain-containing protein [Oscillospiraceae bacterium OttesenSCG-928-F05]|nr:DivIVA domain-containing protein [Oscillospiraceae bacterium OttesenSCG-928-F05]